VKAYITRDTKKSEALWLIIEKTDKSPELASIMGELRIEDLADNTAYAILPDEVKLIRDACNDWLDSQDTDIPSTKS
jgi:hypothetical protein